MGVCQDRSASAWARPASLAGPARVLGRAVWAVALLLLLLAAPCAARASVSLLLEQPYGKLGIVDPTGHSAIYLDHVCAETPLKLRPCRPGELGVVLSRYDGIDHYDWLAIPLIPYLYAVSSVEDIPQSVNRATADRLRDQYRRQHLEAIAPDVEHGETPPGNWHELVGSSFDRTIYGFRLKTTPEQEERLIAIFNDRKNVEKYNLFRNCADFARLTVDMVYPHAVHRNWIGDLGLTSPKSVARGMAHYAHKHPEAGLTVFVIPQVKGDLPRSHKTEGVTESLLKRYGLPLVVLSPVTTGVVLAAYVGHGRFAMPRNAPLLNVDQLQTEADVTRGLPVVGIPAAGMPAAGMPAAGMPALLRSSPPLTPPDPPEVVLEQARQRIEP